MTTSQTWNKVYVGGIPVNVTMVAREGIPALRAIVVDILDWPLAEGTDFRLAEAVHMRTYPTEHGRSLVHIIRHLVIAYAPDVYAVNTATTTTVNPAPSSPSRRYPDGQSKHIYMTRNALCYWCKSEEPPSVQVDTQRQQGIWRRKPTPTVCCSRLSNLWRM
jgi:hypothetical protein